MRTGTLHKLTAKTVQYADDGMHSDGGGLFLRVKGTSRSWVFRFTLDGRKREMGLGPARSVKLADVRTRAAECREQLADGVDPLAARETPARKVRAVPTFKVALDEYLGAHRGSWKSDKSEPQWRSSLESYAGALMALPVDEIEMQDVTDALTPIWLTKQETARRVRSRIALVLSREIALKHRPGPNPAALADNLEHILPKQNRTVQHFAAAPVDAAPGMFAALWDKRKSGHGYAAVCFVVLTACRSGEARHLEWGDVQGDTIIIPGERMKAGAKHRIPITPLVAELLDGLHRDARTELVFQSSRSAPLSDMTLTAAMRRSFKDAPTVHGWRSTFRDWASGKGITNDIAEDQLAHVFGSKTERAYRRKDLLERRRPVMHQWEDFLCPTK